ncbi:uncharacterized protein ColSpa_08870 [Colletotrichum spaethianum]|uniref:Uncharacterized protein n=1 Tax=Colletotrichum spaethianum TaxID=700344 RepID=A0AA37UIW3_9PEZI|nr:uncharacterized protein ColSpa_08870 [Colletotrichum spaethianum]GKT48689.1 hypothetical protein ColSpa_08870 [Colletotrichum spaethianum]
MRLPGRHLTKTTTRPASRFSVTLPPAEEATSRTPVEVTTPKESPIGLGDRDDNRADDAASLSNENDSSDDDRDGDSDEEDSNNESIQMVNTPTPAHDKAGRSNRRSRAGNYHRSLEDTISTLDKEMATAPDNELRKEVLVIFDEFFKKKSKQENSNASFVTNGVVRGVKEACQRARDAKMTGVSGWSAKLPSHAQVLAVCMLHKNGYLVESIGGCLAELQRSSLAQVRDTGFTGEATSGTPAIETLLQWKEGVTTWQGKVKAKFEDLAATHDKAINQLHVKIKAKRDSNIAQNDMINQLRGELAAKVHRKVSIPAKLAAKFEEFNAMSDKLNAIDHKTNMENRNGHTTNPANSHGKATTGGSKSGRNATGSRSNGNPRPPNVEPHAFSAEGVAKAQKATNPYAKATKKRDAPGAATGTPTKKAHTNKGKGTNRLPGDMDL